MVCFEGKQPSDKNLKVDLCIIFGCFVLDNNFIPCQFFVLSSRQDQVKELHPLFLAKLGIQRNEQTTYVIQDLSSRWLRSVRGSSGGKTALCVSWCFGAFLELSSEAWGESGLDLPLKRSRQSQQHSNRRQPCKMQGLMRLPKSRCTLSWNRPMSRAGTGSPGSKSRREECA